MELVAQRRARESEEKDLTFPGIFVFFLFHVDRFEFMFVVVEVYESVIVFSWPSDCVEKRRSVMTFVMFAILCLWESVCLLWLI